MIFISLTFVILPCFTSSANTCLYSTSLFYLHLIYFSCITLLFCLWISILCRNPFYLLVLVLSLLVTLFLLLMVIQALYLLAQCSYLYKCLFSCPCLFSHHPTLYFSYPLKLSDYLSLQIQSYNRFTLVEKQFFLYSKTHFWYSWILDFCLF